ncbi:MAG: RdgB/HAM1 family non-canonical purine NTP pyrophosphatase [Bacteroidota bacterium]
MEKEILFFGTGNAGKLQEINEILGDRFELQSFRDLPEKIEVEETEDTLEGNAELKARALFTVVGIPCFADDTGLEVTALDGRPGVYSARYAGPDGNAENNMTKLLQELNGAEDRSAQFRTAICYYDGVNLHRFEGVLKGRIGHERRGTNGFGYDPLFIPEGQDRTLAEMPSEEKNAISHRGKAVRTFAQFIDEFFAT